MSDKPEQNYSFSIDNHILENMFPLENHGYCYSFIPEIVGLVVPWLAHKLDAFILVRHLSFVSHWIATSSFQPRKYTL